MNKEYYRKMLRSVVDGLAIFDKNINREKLVDDSYMLSVLWSIYEKAKADDWWGLDMFYVSIGLLFFGNIELISDVVKSYATLNVGISENRNEPSSRLIYFSRLLYLAL